MQSYGHGLERLTAGERLPRRSEKDKLREPAEEEIAAAREELKAIRAGKSVEEIVRQIESRGDPDIRLSLTEEAVISSGDFLVRHKTYRKRRENSLSSPTARRD